MFRHFSPKTFHREALLFVSICEFSLENQEKTIGKFGDFWHTLNDLTAWYHILFINNLFKKYLTRSRIPNNPLSFDQTGVTKYLIPSPDPGYSGDSYYVNIISSPLFRLKYCKLFLKRTL